MTEKMNYITSEGYEKIVQELNELKSVKRKEIANRIQEAKELGDLSENAEYAEAKNEQSFTEGRIFHLENFIRNVTIIDKKAHNHKSKRIEIGSMITIKSGENEATYTIVGSNEADPLKGLISNESPMGQTFIGHSIDDEVQVAAPKGIITYRVISIS
ncbi:MAG: transcription elongation factor GreA [Patescibacteria group bacterium]|jgi:transcription elongation factor GreA